jgi:hypothetical protein
MRTRFQDGVAVGMSVLICLVPSLVYIVFHHIYLHNVFFFHLLLHLRTEHTLLQPASPNVVWICYFYTFELEPPAEASKLTSYYTYTTVTRRRPP